jgi:hypothetical protein
MSKMSKRETESKVNAKKVDLKSQLVFALVSLLFYAFFFGHNEADLMPSLMLSGLLLPVTLGTSYYVNAVLLPKYYFTKRYRLFVIKGLYTLILSAFFITATYTFAFITLGDMKLGNLSL